MKVKANGGMTNTVKVVFVGIYRRRFRYTFLSLPPLALFIRGTELCSPRLIARTLNFVFHVLQAGGHSQRHALRRTPSSFTRARDEFSNILTSYIPTTRNYVT